MTPGLATMSLARYRDLPLVIVPFSMLVHTPLRGPGYFVQFEDEELRQNEDLQ